ncbi:protein kinase domain-containing protein [Leptolyngbya sp. O-77]|uniref:protein kinase domain-containing protein n=1 Tax=Leptolyngbya sp. O-77 TaxID=1080068 RepID=UPI00074D3EEE|nr:WG repeat-containing protein [Leptolyngbya sp. O-77]BAU43509.1 Serine/threonine-protein kinase B [Leptolyngbya sp. O-77]
MVKKIQPQSKLPSVLAQARSLFEAEVEKLYVIGKHDQIPKLYDHLEQGGEFYLVQELIDGHDLRQSLFLGDRRDEKEVLGFLHEVLEILAVAHAQNVVHQDLKPQNLLRRWSDKKLVLIDFGNVKVIRHLMVNAEGKPYFTQTVGTAGYVPPEQSAGQPVPASDLYALGMLAIQALTGLFSQTASPRSRRRAKSRGGDEARVSAQLADALDGMVRQSVEQRFRSVAEVRAALPVLPTAKTLSPEELAQFLGEPERPRYELAIAPQFDLARNFSEGLAAVVLKNRLGYISKSGDIAIPLKIEVDPIGIYREGAYEFSEGLARISVGQRWGYINDLGKLAIAPQFDSAENFFGRASAGSSKTTATATSTPAGNG